MVLSAACRRPCQAVHLHAGSIWVSQDSTFKALLKGHFPPEAFPDSSTVFSGCFLFMHPLSHLLSQGICQGHR